MTKLNVYKKEVHYEQGVENIYCVDTPEDMFNYNSLFSAGKGILELKNEEEIKSKFSINYDISERTTYDSSSVVINKPLTKAEQIGLEMVINNEIDF